MAIPFLIVERETQLGRDVTPADFDSHERAEILNLLPHCLREAHATLMLFKSGGPELHQEALRAAEWVGLLEDLYESFARHGHTDLDRPVPLETEP